MSTYALVHRGVISATSADGAGPKDATLSSAIKLGSTFIVPKVREVRHSVAVQRGGVALTSVDLSPKIVSITNVVEARTRVSVSYREKRTNDYSGIMASLDSVNALRLDYGTIGAGDTLDAQWEVVEELPRRRGATLRLVDDETVRLEWDGTLAAGETIDAAYEVFDLSAFGDDVKETLFRLQRLLAYAGENLIQDLLVRDDAGNITSYRLRLFESAAKLADATPDVPVGDPLEDGEIARVNVVQDVAVDVNDRVLLTKELDSVAATPGIG